MKKDITLSDGRIATVTVLKMYAQLTSSSSSYLSRIDSTEVVFSPCTYVMSPHYYLNRFSLEPRRFHQFESVFINSITNEDFCFAKKKGANMHPIGYVIRVQIDGNSYYGVSVKSYKDPWSNQVGLRTAYDRLRRENTELPYELFRDGRLAKLINLAKS